MEKTFHLHIYSPEKVVFEGEVVSLISPTEMGYLGVLADHAPLIATLAPGKIEYREENCKRSSLSCAGKGFMEVLGNNVTILLDYIV